jgi:hypothetical protein
MKKNLLLIAATLFIAVGSMTVTSCGGNTEKPKNETVPTNNDSTKVSAYVCPMGPQCGKGDAAGKCPGCGMDMVKNDKGLK